MSARFSSGGLRRTAIALALLGALTCVGTTPVLAQPGSDSAAIGPFEGLFDWLHDLLQDLGWGPGTEPGEGGGELESPRPTFLPDGSCLDPNGNTVPCPESEGLSPPAGWPIDLDINQ